jgi:hypothetical protein
MKFIIITVVLPKENLHLTPRALSSVCVRRWLDLRIRYCDWRLDGCNPENWDLYAPQQSLMTVVPGSMQSRIMVINVSTDLFWREQEMFSQSLVRHRQTPTDL